MCCSVLCSAYHMHTYQKNDNVMQLRKQDNIVNTQWQFILWTICKTIAVLMFTIYLPQSNIIVLPPIDTNTQLRPTSCPAPEKEAENDKKETLEKSKQKWKLFRNCAYVCCYLMG